MEQTKQEAYTLLYLACLRTAAWTRLLILLLVLQQQMFAKIILLLILLQHRHQSRESLTNPSAANISASVIASIFCCVVFEVLIRAFDGWWLMVDGSKLTNLQSCSSILFTLLLSLYIPLSSVPSHLVGMQPWQSSHHNAAHQMQNVVSVHTFVPQTGQWHNYFLRSRPRGPTSLLWSPVKHARRKKLKSEGSLIVKEQLNLKKCK